MSLRVDVHHHFYPPQYLKAMRAGQTAAVFPA